MPSKNQARSGFTLIELMIVVGVIGILASIAYPSYLDYVRKARRTDAQSQMFDIQLLEEKFLVNNLAYTAYNLDTTYYNFNVPTPAGATSKDYEITATANMGTSQASDTGCTTMKLNHEGVKYPTEGCWKK